MSSVLLLLAMRMPCWPFEVEGPDTPPPATPPTGETAAAPSPLATTPAPSNPIVAPAPITPAPRAPLPLSLPQNEEAHYDIRYGIFGSVGHLSFMADGVADAPDGARVVMVHGQGRGAILGLGGMERRIEAEFDPTMLGSRRWTVVRLRDGAKESEATIDRGARDHGQALVLERSKPGQPAARQIVNFSAPTSDPLGLLWRLRMAPPARGHTETLQLLDGLALWRVRVTTAVAGELLPDVDTPALRLDGELTPILYDGRPDTGRPTRTFTLWLSDGKQHLPLRLEVPVGLGEVVMTLSAIRRLGADEIRGIPDAREARRDLAIPRSPPERVD